MPKIHVIGGVSDKDAPKEPTEDAVEVPVERKDAPVQRKSRTKE